MKIDKAGVPFIAGALVPAAGLALNKRYGWAAAFTALGGFFAYFFRDPERQVPSAPGLVVSPADGRVMIAGPTDGRWGPTPRHSLPGCDFVVSKATTSSTKGCSPHSRADSWTVT